MIHKRHCVAGVNRPYKPDVPQFNREPLPAETGPRGIAYRYVGRISAGVPGTLLC